MAEPARMRDFRSMRVWARSHQLTLDAYRASASFPREELFGLTSQIRRAASSIPANVAEGRGRGGKDFGRFCRIAAGSASELQYHFILAKDPGYLDPRTFERLQQQAADVSGMLFRLLARLDVDRSSGTQSASIPDSSSLNQEVGDFT